MGKSINYSFTNSKRSGQSQLINATSFGVAIQKSIGDKQRIISYDNIKRITNLYLELKESKYSELLSNEDFGYRKIIIERPLRLNFQVSGERLAHLQKKKIVLALAKDRKNKIQSPPSEIADEETYTSAVLDLLHKFPNVLYKDRAIFNQLLQERAKATKLILGPALTTVILDVLGQRDETAEICFNKEGKPEPDPELRETENIPLGQDYWTYFVQQVSSHVPDAWVNPEVRDHKDGEVGIVGYEVKYNIYNSLVADYELLELTRNLSIEPSTIAEISTAVNFLHATEHPEFEERPNSIYLPLTGFSEVVTTFSQPTPKHPSGYAQIVLDPNKAVALYVAGFFNRKIGKLLRKQIMTRMTVPRISKELISRLQVYLPDRETQVKTIEADTKVTNLISDDAISTSV